jgi:hypothetical protein
MAWLEAEITWAVTDGEPPLAVEGGALEPADVPTVRFDATGGALLIPAGGPPLRCHALAYVLRVDGTGPIDIELAAREAEEWRPAASYEMPGPGTYIGLVALEKKPRTIDAVRVSLAGVSDAVVYDLALLTFG